MCVCVCDKISGKVDKPTLTMDSSMIFCSLFKKMKYNFWIVVAPERVTNENANMDIR